MILEFAADRMLGRLAKWLRFLGYDTLYFNWTADNEFLALADQGRILLTRNTSLIGKVVPDHFVFVEDNDPREQLRFVVGTLGLKPDPRSFFTRCALCNGSLERVPRKAVHGKVPDYVRTVHDQFSRCTACGKIYWPGSHLARCRKEIENLLEI